MRGQVGNWGGELSFGFGDEMLAWLDDFGTNRYVMASALRVELLDGAGKSVQVSRQVVLAPDTEVDELSRRVHSRPGNGYKRGVALPHGKVFGLADLVLPRFELHEVDFEVNPLDGTLSCTLPADHVLPWPKLRKECALYTCREEFLKDLLKRMVSALRAGQKGFVGTQRPPQRLIDTLRPGEWRRCMDDALRIAG